MSMLSVHPQSDAGQAEAPAAQFDPAAYGALPYLNDEHRRMLAESAISPDVAQARGYTTVVDPSDLEGIFPPKQWHVPCLLIPIHDVHGERRLCQIRPDVPPIGRGGKTVKYLTPAGVKLTLDIPPSVRPILGDVSRPLLITEGARKADAAVTAGLDCISVIGVWGWKRKDFPFPCWESIEVKERTFYLAFDSDAATNPSVKRAQRDLTGFLRERGAKVVTLYIPAGESGSKVGLDDYLAAGHTAADVLALTKPAKSDTGGDDDDEPRAERKTQAQRIIELAEAAGAELFRSPTGDAYITVPMDGHAETWPVHRKACRQWLIRLHWTEEAKVPGSQAVQDAISTLDAKAVFEGAEHRVHRRVAAHDGRIYIDLCNASWQAVEVDASGWRVVDHPPVKFVRGQAMQALPMPVNDGRLDVIRPFLNVGADGWVLLAAWLVGALRPDSPYCPLVLTGRKGCAKSSMARLIQAVIDPTAIDPRRLPTKPDDLFIACQGCHVAHFDNISAVPDWLSDCLCQVSDGGSSTKRQLYSDDDEVILSARKPVVLTGIGDYVTKSDLLDRAIRIELAPIPSSERKTEAALWRDVELILPSAFGGLLDAVACAIRRLPDVTIDEPGRRADFCLWVTAAAPALGFNDGDFMRAYRTMGEAARDVILESEPITRGLVEWLEGQTPDERGTIGVTANALREALTKPYKDAGEKPPDGWPRNARALSTNVESIADALEGVGIIYRRKRTRDGRILEFRLVPKRAGFASTNTFCVNPDGSEDPPLTQNDPVDAKRPEFSKSLNLNQRLQHATNGTSAEPAPEWPCGCGKRSIGPSCWNCGTPRPAESEAAP